MNWRDSLITTCLYCRPWTRHFVETTMAKDYTPMVDDLFARECSIGHFILHFGTWTSCNQDHGKLPLTCNILIQMITFSEYVIKADIDSHSTDMWSLGALTWPFRRRHFWHSTRKTSYFDLPHSTVRSGHPLMLLRIIHLVDSMENYVKQPVCTPMCGHQSLCCCLSLRPPLRKFCLLLRIKRELWLINVTLIITSGSFYVTGYTGIIL